KANSSTALASSANPSVSGQGVTYTATVSASSPGTGTPSGTVTFKDGGTAIGTGNLSSGVATFATNYASAGSHSITAEYSGDSNFNTSTNSALTQTVNKASTTMAVTSGTNPSVSGQSVTYTATLSVTSPGSGNATGSVTFKDGATTLGTGTLSGNVATLSNGSLSVGSHTITAEYVGDSNFGGTTNSSLSQTVNKASTTMAVTSGTNPSVSGQSVTYTATISVTSPGSGTATGSVTFKDGATTLGTRTLSGNVATLSNGSLSVGSHSITAEFVGDSNLNGSTNSPALSQTVNKADTTTSVSPSVNPSVSGQSVTFTATVAATSPGSGTPSGTVTFKDGATTLGTGTLSSGQATFSTSALSTTSHSITAVYGADSSFNTSTSSALTQTVNAGSTTTAVSSSVNPSVSGQSVTFTATVSAVSPASGTPTGTVTFKDGATTLGTGSLSGGSATFSTSSLSTAAHSITAVYGADSNFNASTSSILTQTVNAASTTTAVTSNHNPSKSGQSVTFTATVSVTSPGSGTATGTVTFKDGGTTLGTGSLNGSGQATYATSSLSVASHSITAEYGGDGNFNTSASSTLTQTVNAASSATLLTSSANPSVVGQSVTFTATVGALFPGAGTPTGTVTFKDGATTLGTGTLSGGSATFSTSSLSIASHPITASYGGDGNFNTSASSALSQVVNTGHASVTVTSSVNPSIVNQSVTATATVSAAAPATGSPTGTIQFVVDSIYYVGSPVALSAGAATSGALPGLTQGAHTVAAIYSGDSNFNSVTNTVTQTVNAPYATCTASNNGPVCEGNTLQLSGTTTDTGSDVYYSWTGPNGFTSTNQNPTISSVTANDAGTYWLTTGKTGTTNCIEMTVVSVAPALAASVSADTVCTGTSGNITANPSGGTAPYSYVWSPGGATTQTISVTDGGLYTVTVTDSTGTSHCSVQASGALTLKALPACAINGANTVCPNSTNSYSAPAGMSSYAWSVTGAATIGGAANAQSVSVVAAAGCNTNFSVSLNVTSNGCLSACSTNVNVIDTTAPAITSVPADATVSCVNAIPAANDGAVVASDDCSSVTVTHLSDSVTSSNCPNHFTVTRTYVATDACGNSSSASQTITVHDTTGPVITGFPADATYSCSASVPAADDGAVSATDACGGSVSVTHSDDAVTAGSCANRYTIARTYTATDACGNSTTQTQNITVNDSTAPVLAGVPADVTVQCNAVPSAATPTATDNCDSGPSISFNESSAAGSCPGNYTITRTWTATDACGNSSSATQTITVIDTTAPVLAGVPAAATAQCDNVPAPASPTATDTCDNNPSISYNQTSAAGSCAGSYVLTRTWTATDACGNHSSASQTITVIDTAAPTLAGIPADATVQCDAVPAAASPTATDTCDTNAAISFNETRAAGSCANSYVLTRTWTATDACGNSSSASQTITVIDTTAPVIA
ncbi:MAG: beta strand repeat-containing protein, partial [Limisphaerales bacterium]